MEGNMQWFVVNVHTGCEDKVARSLREQIDKRKLNALFGEILVPTREVTEVKAGKRVKTEKKFFPGYIVVQMELNNETFSLVKLMPRHQVIYEWIAVKIAYVKAEEPNHANAYRIAAAP